MLAPAAFWLMGFIAAAAGGDDAREVVPAPLPSSSANSPPAGYGSVDATRAAARQAEHERQAAIARQAAAVGQRQLRAYGGHPFYGLNTPPYAQSHFGGVYGYGRGRHGGPAFQVELFFGPAYRSPVPFWTYQPGMYPPMYGYRPLLPYGYAGGLPPAAVGQGYAPPPAPPVVSEPPVANELPAANEPPADLPEAVPPPPARSGRAREF